MRGMGASYFTRFLDYDVLMNPMGRFFSGRIRIPRRFAHGREDQAFSVDIEPVSPWKEYGQIKQVSLSGGVHVAFYQSSTTTSDGLSSLPCRRVGYLYLHYSDRILQTTYFPFLARHQQFVLLLSR